MVSETLFHCSIGKGFFVLSEFKVKFKQLLESKRFQNFTAIGKRCESQIEIIIRLDSDIQNLIEKMSA